jgi:murein DD-endopeptidase MepM/ murein hydrolase activator NlpD
MVMAPRYTSIVVTGALLGAGIADAAGPAYGTYAWPVEGPVIRGFEPPPDPYGVGHRGIDIGAPFGTDLVAAEDGVVAFAGWVAGSLFISIDHDDGVRSTYSWLSTVDVVEGQTVARGQVIGKTGQGHPDLPTPHLHFGTKVGETYIDPMLMLERGSVAGLIHLAPLAPPPGRGPPPPLPERAGSWAPYNERSWRGPPAHAQTTASAGLVSPVAGSWPV